MQHSSWITTDWLLLKHWRGLTLLLDHDWIVILMAAVAVEVRAGFNPRRLCRILTILVDVPV